MRIPILCMSAGSRAWLQTHPHPPLTVQATVYYSATFWPSLIKNAHLSLSRLHVTTKLQSGHPYRLHVATRLQPGHRYRLHRGYSLAIPNAHLSLYSVQVSRYTSQQSYIIILASQNQEHRPVKCYILPIVFAQTDTFSHGWTIGTCGRLRAVGPSKQNLQEQGGVQHAAQH